MEMKQLIESLQRQLDQERALLAKMDAADKSSESRIKALIDQIVVLTEQRAYFQNPVLGPKSEQSKKGEASSDRLKHAKAKTLSIAKRWKFPNRPPDHPQKRKKGTKQTASRTFP